MAGNIIFFGVDSLRTDHMSLFGYDRLTTPHITEFAEGGVSFANCISPSIPTTSGYASMLTGMDCFSTNVVALRHKGGISEGVKTLPEILRENGYETTSIGFKGNPSARGFDNYIEYKSWGSWSEGKSHKAEAMNKAAIPELERLAAGDKPFMLFLRHMDPHSPYLPPEPFQRMFYGGNELDPANDSLKKVYDFKPFSDYFLTWFPPGCTDREYISAQYDSAVAYMDSCISNIFAKLAELGIEENTLVVITSDHGETLYEHDCYYDHHGLYECTLTVPLVFRWEGKIPAGWMFDDICQVKDITPTILDILGIEAGIKFDGRSLMPVVQGKPREQETGMYITECTWMRKHGYRTPEWKLIRALEPDFHFKPETELYNLINDPQELENVADKYPEVVTMLSERMRKHIEARTAATGRENPMYTNLDWHGRGCGPFKTSQQAYDTLHIGDPEAARKLQAQAAKQ
ncbi:MAG: sulfatase [Eubacteriales bacterium]|nr:sulfatase [Eubacteriales bacterium]